MFGFMIHRYLPFIFVALVIVLLSPTLAGACPSCNLIEDPIFRGFNWSILFLMAMPFTVFGIIGGSVLYTYKRVNKTDNQKPKNNT